MLTNTLSPPQEKVCLQTSESGSFTHHAFLKFCKFHPEYNFSIHTFSGTPQKAFADAGNDSGGKYVFVAVYNEAIGCVRETVEAFTQFTGEIVGSIQMEVRHSLLVHSDMPEGYMPNIIASHPAALQQVWGLLPAEVSTFIGIDGGTSATAKMVTTGILPKEVGVIGPIDLADAYRLRVCRETVRTSVTTFFLLENIQERAEDEIPSIPEIEAMITEAMITKEISSALNK